MVTPTPTDRIKHQLRQMLAKAFKQLRDKAPIDQWEEFQGFFWKIRPLIDIDIIKFEGASDSETSGPNYPYRPTPSVVGQKNENLQLSFTFDSE